jgi:complement component 1 Q subcomponent-binding protein
MLGLRNLARNAPRSAARLSTKAIRPQSSVFRQTAAFQPAWTASVPRLTASFHVSARRQESGAGKMHPEKKSAMMLIAR